jgi:glycosyltransferase involved in cell wall biosynthesis
MKVKYYKNFIEDYSPSMDQYAQQLIRYQKNYFKNLDISSYQPTLSSLSKFIPSDIWKLRYSRYISYPQQSKKLPRHDIAHICDQQYAHLYPYLNSKLKFITVNDLNPIVFQEKLSHNPKLIKFSLRSLKFYTKVFAISSNTKKDIVKFTDCPEEKIEVIMRAIEPFFNNDSIDNKITAKKYNIPANKKKILISGNAYYKNNFISYKILERLIELNQNIVLIHVGSNNYKNNISLKLENNIIRLPFVEREELPNIYKLADILLFPSIYEGFGLPILESMSCGTPVVCSNNSSIPEIVGDAALTNDHDDVSSFTKNILNLFSNNELYKKMIDKGLSRSKLFSINKFHHKLIEIYKDELNRLK